MIPRPDMLDSKSPPGLEVYQLTTDPEVPGSHVYMEAQIFTLDSSHFLLHCHATAHGPLHDNPHHQYLRCDIDDNCSLHPIIEESGTTSPSVSPDGKYVYYFVDETSLTGGRLILKRVNLDGSDRTTVMVVEALPGTNYYPSNLYPISTISSDGRCLALPAFLGDGKTQDAPSGLMVFDLQNATVELIVHGPDWLNLHPQYCRSTDPEAARDILIQHNHGGRREINGEITKLVAGLGADIHVIRDDGTNFRSMPWGRDGTEGCQGHQCWRGKTTAAITSTITRAPRQDNPNAEQSELIEGQPVAHTGHIGAQCPDGRRNNLTREFENAQFFHFGVDRQGETIISDYFEADGDPSNENRKTLLYWARLNKIGSDPASDITYLLNTKTADHKDSHSHPFLSPDGSRGFFNSDESGTLQAYMLRMLPN